MWQTLVESALVVMVWAVGSTLELVAGNYLTATFTDVTPDKGLTSGVTAWTRVSTTIGDSLNIALLFVAGAAYKAGVAEKRRAKVLLVSQGGAAEHAVGAALHDRAPGPTPLAVLPVCLWAALATPLRMGDTFYASGILGSFYTPLWVLFLARVAALGIGAVPGMYGGVPSLVTQLAQGIYYHGVRQDLRQWVRARDLCIGDHPEAHGSTCLRRGLDFCVDVVGYAFCCCLMARADARLVDERSGTQMAGCLSIIGAPVHVG